MVHNTWKWMSHVNEHWHVHPQPHIKIKVSCLLYNCIIASVTDLVLLCNKLWILYADLVNGMFTKWIYLYSLIGGCLEKLAGWERMIQESHFSASAGAVKRKTGCLAVGVWGLGGWGCTGLGPLPSPLQGGLRPGHVHRHGASPSWLPGWAGHVGAAPGLGYPGSAPPWRSHRYGDACRGGSTLHPAAVTASFFKISFLNLAILSTVD